MQDIIAKIASMIPSMLDSIEGYEECPSSTTEVVFDTAESEPNGSACGDGDTKNYMFFNNLESMREMIDEILSMDRSALDQALSAEHDWASDHISSAQENIQQVHSWLSSEDSCH